MKDAIDKKLDAGATIRKRRTLRGHSLETVHQHTRIPKDLLQAFEENNPAAFPASVYMRGFLQSYCDFLELDFDPLWQEFAPKHEHPTLISPHESQSTGKTPLLPPRVSTREIMIGACALLLATLGIWTLRGGHPFEEPASRNTAGNHEPLPIHIFAVGDCHIRLKIDGTLRFEGRMARGGKFDDWKAVSKFSLRTHDPKNLRISFAGAEVLLSDIPADSGGWRTISR